jgi:hypothetical protein
MLRLFVQEIEIDRQLPKWKLVRYMENHSSDKDLKAVKEWLSTVRNNDFFDDDMDIEAEILDSDTPGLPDNKIQQTPDGSLSIDVNSDGTILIHDGGFYLHNDGTGEWATRVFKFTNQNVNTNSSAYRFRVCEESELFDSFAARKVSVQDLTVNNRFLIYRKFEDSQGNEQLYALASDGTFVRVYDGGDTLVDAVLDGERII